MVCRNVFPENLSFDIVGMSFEKYSAVLFSFPYSHSVLWKLEYVKAHYRGGGGSHSWKYCVLAVM